MRILIDADGCPVVDETVVLAKKYGIECLILCDTSHVFEKDGAETRIFDKGADSVDSALVNLIKKGDVVITQDYGLAAMCLARRAITINQNGKEYTAENIDALLLSRYTAKKIRNAGGRLKGPAKRLAEQDEYFKTTLEKILLQVKENL